MRVDGGEWFILNGTVDWNHSLLIEEIANGDHTLDARCFDGAHYSEIKSTKININHRPVVEASSITESKDRSGWLTFSGSALDDVGIEKITYRIDGGDWIDLNTTGDWDIEIKEDDLPIGEHTIEIKAYDGHIYSETFSYNFTSERLSESDDISSYVVVMAICIVVIVAAVAYWNNRVRS